MFLKQLLVFSFVFSMGVNAQAVKTFVYCSEGSPKIFNPQLATDGPTFNASASTLYDRLVEFKPGSTEVIPSLAKSWKISKDGLIYTFFLRKDVQFHTRKYFKPTRKFNAEDVLFTFLRMHDPVHPYHKINGGTYTYYKSMNLHKIIKEIKKVDDYTVQFILNQPEAPFLANMAMKFASILSQEYAINLSKKKKSKNIDFKPIGTGPFKFKRYVKDNVIRYEGFENYFAGKPAIDRLVFAIAPDPSVRYQKLKAGECHLVSEPSPVDLKAMRKNKKIKLLQQPGLNVGYMAFNTEKKPFDNKLVRQAIHHALDRGKYMKAIYLGNAEVAKNPIPPTMWSYNKGVTDYKYNIAKAKKLLKRAGFEKGFETELWTLPISRPYNPNGKKMGELIQSDLAKIGIKVKLVTYKWAQYIEKAQKGEHQMIQLGWTGDNGDPDNFLNILLGCEAIKAGSNMARWCNKGFQKIVTEAKQISNKSKRTKLYKEAQKVFKKEAPWVTIAHSVVYKAMAKNVVGYQISPFGTDTFHTIDLK